LLEASASMRPPAQDAFHIVARVTVLGGRVATAVVCAGVLV